MYRLLELLGLVSVFVVASGCSSTQGLPRTLPDVEEEGGARDLPGDPVLLELETGQSHVVRLVEPEVVSETGRLQVSSTVAGVTISIDGGETVALPQSIEVATGIHEIVATCPDSTTETMNVSVESGATVHLRVCNSMRQP